MCTVTFATIPGEITTSQASMQWLSTGIAFDLEKRLGRMSGLEPADRLQTLTAVRAASAGDPQVKANSVMERLKPAFVLYTDAVLSESKLSIEIKVFTDRGRKVISLRDEGDLNQLFTLIDSLTTKILSSLRDASIDSGKQSSPSALTRTPAKSVDAYGHVIRGMMALQDGRSTEARPELVTGLEAEPDNWWGHYFLGAVDFHEGRLKEAAEECRKAIALDPDLYAGVYANLAYCYQGLGQMEQARSAQHDFELRSGKTLPMRSLPGGPFSAGYSGASQ